MLIGSTLEYLQRFLRCVKLSLLEFMPFTAVLRHLPSIPGTVSTGTIFAFMYTCTHYLHHIHPPTFFPVTSPLPPVPNPSPVSWQNLFHLPVLWFWRTQEISPYSYLYLKLAKTPCFSYYLLCFFFYKIQESKLEAKPWQKVSKTISLQTKSGMVLHTCNPSYAESIYRRIRVQEWHQANDKGQ
jgi:hypothetical protein